MNFADLSTQFQVEGMEVSEEKPSAASHIAPEESPKHRQLEQVWVILYIRPSGPIGVKQIDTVPGVFRKAFGTFKHDMRQEWQKHMEHWKYLSTPNMQADDLEEAGILLGEVYDEKIIGVLLAQGEES